MINIDTLFVVESKTFKELKTELILAQEGDSAEGPKASSGDKADAKKVHKTRKISPEAQ